jgi:hypothetical protein
MTGSAKQSIARLAEAWIASSLALLAMTTVVLIQFLSSSFPLSSSAKADDPVFQRFVLELRRRRILEPRLRAA